MKTVVGVKFSRAGKIYYFDPADKDIKAGDDAIVETARGIEYGNVVTGPKDVQDSEVVEPLKKVLRKATDDDKSNLEKNKRKETEAFDIAVERIQKHKLDMSLVDVEYTFDGNKIIFYFTADGRIDFRELVKELASVFKARIELRQIGVRDETKMIGGLATCGRPVCCNSFLGDFQSVSIKMAKEQNLSLSPTKISGLCGRLMCCLKYEQDYYEKMRKIMPKINKEVVTPDGKGIVLENNAITEKSRIKVALQDGSFEVKEYSVKQLRFDDNIPDEEPELDIVADEEFKLLLD